MLRNNTTQWEEQINFCSPYLIVIWIQISQGQIYTSVDTVQIFAKKKSFPFLSWIQILIGYIVQNKNRVNTYELEFYL